jgi:hypothetical protein
MVDKRIESEYNTEPYDNKDLIIDTPTSESYDFFKSSRTINPLDSNKSEHKSDNYKSNNFTITVQSRPNRPYLFIDVILNGAEKNTISVYHGDTAELLASEFALEHNLGTEAIQSLIELISQQIQNVSNH